MTHVWYVKWAASIAVLIGVAFTSNSVIPWNLYVSVLGTVGWLYVSLKWNDRAMIVMNSIILAVYAQGIISHL